MVAAVVQVSRDWRGAVALLHLGKLVSLVVYSFGLAFPFQPLQLSFWLIKLGWSSPRPPRSPPRSYGQPRASNWDPKCHDFYMKTYKLGMSEGASRMLILCVRPVSGRPVVRQAVDK